MERIIRHSNQKVNIYEPEKPSSEKCFLKGKVFHIEELKAYMSEYKEFKGALMLNELDNFKFPNDNLWGIIILLPPPTPSGKNVGHFIAMVFDTEYYHEIDFFDSFGRTPEKLNIENEITRFIWRFIKEKKPYYKLKIKINKLKKQEKDEARCGTFVVQFLLDRLINRKNFQDATGFSRETMLQKEEDIANEMDEFPVI